MCLRPVTRYATPAWEQVVRTYFRKVWTIARKDFLTEWRSREALSVMVVFAVLAILIFNFALDLAPTDREEVTPGLLWIAFIFAGLLGLNRSFAREREEGNLDGLMLAPVDRSAIYLAKFLSNFAFILSIEIITLPLFAALYNVSLPIVTLAVPVLLGTIGFAVIGTIFAAMAVNTRLRDVLLPILVLPILIPVVIAAVKASAAAIDGQSLIADAGNWIGLLIVFDVLFFTISMLLFDFVLEQ